MPSIHGSTLPVAYTWYFTPSRNSASRKSIGMVGAAGLCDRRPSANHMCACVWCIFWEAAGLDSHITPPFKIIPVGPRLVGWRPDTSGRGPLCSLSTSRPGRRSSEGLPLQRVQYRCTPYFQRLLALLRAAPTPSTTLCRLELDLRLAGTISLTQYCVLCARA